MSSGAGPGPTSHHCSVHDSPLILPHPQAGDIYSFWNIGPWSFSFPFFSKVLFAHLNILSCLLSSWFQQVNSICFFVCFFKIQYNLSGLPFCAAFWVTSSRLVIPPSLFTFCTLVSRAVGLKSMYQSIFNLFTYLSPTMRLTPSLFHINPSHPIWNRVWPWQTFKEETTPFTTPSHALEHSVIVTCVSQQHLMEPYSLLTFFMSCQVAPLRDASPWVPSLAHQNPRWPL